PAPAPPTCRRSGPTAGGWGTPRGRRRTPPSPAPAAGPPSSSPSRAPSTVQLLRVLTHLQVPTSHQKATWPDWGATSRSRGRGVPRGRPSHTAPPDALTPTRHGRERTATH